MKKFVSLLCAAAMSLTSIVATGTVASASPYQVPRTIEAQNNVTEVQYRHRHRGERRGFQRRGGHHYYNGHRGHRQHRRGYRQHNGYWFPPAAFIAGAIIGGALSQPAPRARQQYNSSMSPSHVNWCHDRYRSYRSYDNTFQPYNGPRQQCRSPYY